VSGLFDGTFARGGAAAAVSDDAWFRALLDVEAALARAAAGLGLVPTTAADAVTAACADPARLDLAGVVAQGADAGNPVPPLVRALQDAVGERDAVAVHVGASSRTSWTPRSCCWPGTRSRPSTPTWPPPPSRPPAWR
jgi:adenylosuccinate lyase